MSDPYGEMIKSMDKSEKQLLKEIQKEVNHPLSEYYPGSPRLEKLYEQMELAKRFTWPSEYVLNV